MKLRCIVLLALACLPRLVSAADWPQWRGLNRDAKVTGFQAPKSWPKVLAKKWSVTVGDGCATPSLVGDKLYVFTREGGDEILRCLDAGSGREVWAAHFAARGADGPAAGFAGPRCSPAVADGKVVVLGVRGNLSCYDAGTGKQLWTKSFPQVPGFYTSSSPLIVKGVCVAQLGGNDGAVMGFDLATGEEKWKESDLPTSYASPVLMQLDGLTLVIGQVSDGIVAVDLASGKKVWEKYFDRGGSRYKAATPIVDGTTLIYLDGPATAIKLEKQGDKVIDTPAWKNADSIVEYNTPVYRDGLLFGLSRRSELFCVRAADGKTAWHVPMPGTPAAPAGGGAGGGGPGGGRGFGGFGGGGGQGGYGNIVDAGSVLMALTPSSQLVVYQPTDVEFKQVALYKVSDSPVYAYPVVSDKRIYVKDRDSVTLYTVE